MLAYLKRLFAPKKAPALVPVADFPRYPPWTDGLPVVPPDQLLQSHADLVITIRESLGVRPEFWDAKIYPMLERVAAYVQLLPAAEAGRDLAHHIEAGGLLHHSLETCRWAVQYSKSKNPYQNQMLRMDAVNREEHTQRWKVGVAIAALCHDLGKPITDTRVISKQTGERWRPNRESMFDWAVRTGTTLVVPEWVKGRFGRHMSVSTLHYERIIGDDLQDWISDVDQDLWNDLLASITGDISSNSYIADLVSAGDRRSTELDLADRQRHSRVPPPSFDQSAFLQKVLIYLCKTNVQWGVNTKGMRVWVTAHGVFLTKAALDDVVVELRRNNINTIVHDRDAIAQTLVEGGYAEPSDPDNGKIYWGVSPQILRRATGEPVTLNMIRLIQPWYVFGQMPVPDPIHADVARPDGQNLPLPQAPCLESPPPDEPSDLAGARMDEPFGDEPPPFGETPETVDELPVVQVPGIRGEQHGEDESAAQPGDRSPQWRQAALAERLRDHPDLYDVLTDPDKIVQAVHVGQAPRIFLRIRTLQDLIGAASIKAMITDLAGAGLIVEYSGMSYAHDIGEKERALLLDPEKCGEFHGLIAGLHARAIKDMDPEERSALERKQTPKTRSAVGEKRTRVGGGIILPTKASCSAQPADTESESGRDGDGVALVRSTATTGSETTDRHDNASAGDSTTAVRSPRNPPDRPDRVHKKTGGNKASSKVGKRSEGSERPNVEQSDGEAPSEPKPRRKTTQPKFSFEAKQRALELEAARSVSGDEPPKEASAEGTSQAGPSEASEPMIHYVTSLIKAEIASEQAADGQYRVDTKAIGSALKSESVRQYLEGLGCTITEKSLIIPVSSGLH